MKYKIIDTQNGGYFARGLEFNSKEAIRKQLISYHSIDYTGELPIENFTLNEILDWGDWDIEKII